MKSQLWFVVRKDTDSVLSIEECKIDAQNVMQGFKQKNPNKSFYIRKVSKFAKHLHAEPYSGNYELGD